MWIIDVDHFRKYVDYQHIMCFVTEVVNTLFISLLKGGNTKGVNLKGTLTEIVGHFRVNFENFSV